MSELWFELLVMGATVLVMAGVCAFEGWSR